MPTMKIVFAVGLYSLAWSGSRYQWEDWIHVGLFLRASRNGGIGAVLAFASWISASGQGFGDPHTQGTYTLLYYSSFHFLFH